MTPLAGILARRIAAGGPIPVAEFMATALLHPEHGYYTGRDPLGRAGDFVTAPEVSQVFGELVGLWCAETWRQAGAPDPVRLVELGPGRGTLMADALRALRQAPDFRAAAIVHLVEASPVLRARQQEALAGQTATWHGGIEDVPDGPLLLIANEFFDALPVHQLVRAPAGWVERMVALDGDTLVFAPDDRPTPRAALLPAALREAAPVGSLVEVSPAALGIVATIARRIGREGGAALIVDYGHDATAPGDTLQAVRRHRPHEVLVDPGAADLTAHVDFSALARAAAPEAAAHGPVGQGTFLVRLGVEVRARTLAAAGPDGAAAVEVGVRRLIAPDQMGTLFRAMALTRPDAPVPAGFEAADPGPQAT